MIFPAQGAGRRAGAQLFKTALQQKSRMNRSAKAGVLKICFFAVEWRRGSDGVNCEARIPAFFI